jgi:hypothetical protein
MPVNIAYSVKEAKQVDEEARLRPCMDAHRLHAFLSLNASARDHGGTEEGLTSWCRACRSNAEKRFKESGFAI